MKRSVRIVGTDVVLDISKVTAVHLDNAEMIHFDKLKDGTWRLIYNPKVIPDLTKVISFEMVREE